jgi:hypothetical protein
MNGIPRPHIAGGQYKDVEQGKDAFVVVIHVVPPGPELEERGP